MMATVAAMRALVEDEIETIEHMPVRHFDGETMIERGDELGARLETLKGLLALIDTASGDPDVMVRLGRALTRGGQR